LLFAVDCGSSVGVILSYVFYSLVIKSGSVGLNIAIELPINGTSASYFLLNVVIRNDLISSRIKVLAICYFSMFGN